VTLPTPFAGRQLHFVGIGGAGMSGLAHVARALGAQVTGSDRDPGSSNAQRLGAAGIDVRPHAAENVPPAAEVVYSTAIGPDNPERSTGAPELHRAELLGELTRLKPTIAVTGTHGKTTTSSMVVHVLERCGLAPSYLIGGDVRTTGTNADWQEGEWLVVEADESDRSLLGLDKRIAVLTNAELDHHATYGSLREVEETFTTFLTSAQVAVVTPPVARLVPDGVEAVVLDPQAELTAGGSRFTHAGHPVVLAVPGAHNVANAALALEAAIRAGAEPGQAAASLADFAGAGRRFERLGHTASGAEVVDDYAHHPTEVAATLAAARTLHPRRVVAVFQPHLFSRTAAQAREFGAALAAADVVVVTDVYPARERAEDFPGVTGRLVAAAAADAAPGRAVAWLPRFDDARPFLEETLREGDLLLTLGAGNVDALGRALIAR
jgi:UDP-N-acetylmuramate--alanine ligase